MENPSFIFSDTFEIVNIVICVYSLEIGITNCFPNPILRDMTFLGDMLGMKRKYDVHILI